MKQKPINWTAIAAIGQLFSAVAVALTLIYLTMQIRRAEIAASDANRLARANGVVTFWLEAMHDPEFREAGLRINPNNREWTAEISRRMEISEADAMLLQNEVLYWFWLHWGQWNTSTEQKDIDELVNMIRRFYTMPQVRLVWEGHRGWLDPRFEEFVDEVLAEADANPPPPPDREALYRRLDELGIGKPRPPAEEADEAAGK